MDLQSELLHTPDSDLQHTNYRATWASLGFNQPQPYHYGWGRNIIAGPGKVDSQVPITFTVYKLRIRSGLVRSGCGNYRGLYNMIWPGRILTTRLGCTTARVK